MPWINCVCMWILKITVSVALFLVLGAIVAGGWGVENTFASGPSTSGTVVIQPGSQPPSSEPSTVQSAGGGGGVTQQTLSLDPFSTIKQINEANGEARGATQGGVNQVCLEQNGTRSCTVPSARTRPIVDTTNKVKLVKFADKDLLTEWMPWVIKNLSILMGGLSFIAFSYAGILLFYKGDDPEQITNSLKIITFSIIGLTVSALSYAIVKTLLNLF